MAQLKTFLKFVKERESIRLKKAAGEPAPWTKDRILQTYRFCNIRRSDDRVSRWLIRNVLVESDIIPCIPSFLEISAWCRWVNWPPTIQKVKEAGLFAAATIDWRRVGKFVDHLDGKKWTGAYMIAAPRGENKPGKGVFVARDIIQKSFRPLVSLLVVNAAANGGAFSSCEGTWNLLREAPYFGKFMAGQIVADWTYTPLLRNAPDVDVWAPIGPGSRRGFNRLKGRPLKTKIDPVEWQFGIVSLRYEVQKLRLGYVTAMDVQNQLCEFDKYLRVKQGEGRPRAKYRPETAYEV